LDKKVKLAIDLLRQHIRGDPVEQLNELKRRILELLCKKSWSGINEVLQKIDVVRNEAKAIQEMAPAVHEIPDQTYVDAFNNALIGTGDPGWECQMVITNIEILRTRPWEETYACTRKLLDRYLVKERAARAKDTVAGISDTGLIMTAQNSKIPKTTKPCRYWDKNGKCFKGNSCDFVHNVCRDIRKPNDDCVIRKTNLKRPQPYNNSKEEKNPKKKKTGFKVNTAATENNDENYRPDTPPNNGTNSDTSDSESMSVSSTKSK
jgi:hypothetical protein